MSLPTPSLDDRQFQDIVDEVKRKITRYCPGWTDHNVSDPGVALIELFAWMTEMVIYRLNQVPDRLYSRFLELVGLERLPASAAGVDLLFRLTSARPDPVPVSAGTQVGTIRTPERESILFTTTSDVAVHPAELVACRTVTADGVHADVWNELRAPRHTVAVWPGMAAGDAVLFGFATPLPRNMVQLRLTGEVRSVGMNPDRPPWAWEAWTRDGWRPADVLQDRTRAFQVPGELLVLLPEGHAPQTEDTRRVSWLRCRLTEWAPVDHAPDLRSPAIDQVQVESIGVSAPAEHAERMPTEVLGHSDGTPGQAFPVRRRPVLPPGEDVVVWTGGTAQTWTCRPDFSRSGEQDRHYRWDYVSGEVCFGPFVREADGTGRQYGAVPPPDARIELTGYRVGGGYDGNVESGSLSVLKKSIPFVASVTNHQPARGGADAETVDEVKQRAPLTLLSGRRAVTRDDFERMAHEASRDIARARCLAPEVVTPRDEEPPTEDTPVPAELPEWVRREMGERGVARPEEPGAGPSPPGVALPAALKPIRVLLVRRSTATPERMDLNELVPPEPLLRAVQRYLDERRTLTAQVVLRNVWFQGVQVEAEIVPSSTASPEVVRERALSTLYRYINPLTGGPDGTGWPFDRPLTVGEVWGRLAAVPGVAEVLECALRPVEHMKRDSAVPQPAPGAEPSDPAVRARLTRVPLDPDALFASHRHRVTVVEGNGSDR